MSPFTEPAMFIECHPKPPLYLSKTSESRVWIERYCEPNDGYIEIINDSDDEDPNQLQDYSGVISALKERAEMIDIKKSLPKSRKSSPKNSSAIPLCPPIKGHQRLQHAPKYAIIPATLSQRKKCRHHAGGWHHRTMLECKAAEKLLSCIEFTIENVMPIVTKLVAEARQRTLRQIAEGDDLTIKQSLEAVVEELGDIPGLYVVEKNYVKDVVKEVIEDMVNDVADDFVTEESIAVEKVGAEVENMSERLSEWLNTLSEILETKLGRSCELKRGEDGGEMDVGLYD